MLCPRCTKFHSLSTATCLSCQEFYLKYAFKIDAVQSSSENFFHLFHYTDAVRDLILQSKVQCKYAALKMILELAEIHPFTKHILTWADVIVPVPSSFWGRLRGRYDIVACLCSKLSGTYKKELLTLRVPLYWRISKRAMTKNSSEIRNTMPKTTIPADFLNEKRFLLVDDVSSTGYTLAEAAKWLGAKDYKALAIAGNKL
jgi:predicted amidophosphoribosyltransferase